MDGINLRWDAGNTGLVMLIHQIHYFSYAYVLLYLLLRQGAFNPYIEVKHVIVGAILFALGWASYISGEFVLKTMLKLSPIVAIISGHIWVVLWLLSIVFYMQHFALVGTAWVVAGFGGGSVYAIKCLAKNLHCTADLELWEHLGHVVGVLFAIVLVGLMQQKLEAPFILSVVAATAVSGRIAHLSHID